MGFFGDFPLSSASDTRWPSRNLYLWCIVLSSFFYSSTCLPRPEAAQVQVLDSFAGPSWDWAQYLLISVPNFEGTSTETVSLKFKPSFRSRREVQANELYPHGQVLELQRASANSSLSIKLERRFLVDPSFTLHLPEDAEHERLDEEEEDHVVYSGRVHETSGSGREIGSAALSICGDSGGLCGLLMLETEHLLIQPHPQQLAASDSDSVELVDHIHVLATVNASELESSLVNDELRVPAAKLAAAADDRIRQKESPRPPRRRPTLLVPLEPDFSDDSKPSLRMEPPKQSKPLPLSVKNSKNARGDAKKKVIEIAVFTDQDLYEKMRKRFPKDTVQKMKDYVVTMINTMDLLYQHKSLGVPIEFSLVHLEIMKKYPAKLNKNGGKAMAYLSSFCDYAGEKNVNGEMWDHALMLTGMDLREDGTTSTAGLAWAGTMCYRYYSCSISEGNSFGTAYIITHEIGHSLGMEHDGMGVSKTCDRDKFLMSPTTGPGKVEWSSCSKQNLEEFLKYGSAELRKSSRPHVPECLSESKRSSHSKIEVAADMNNLPGKRYDASQQCVLAMGSRFKPVLRKAEPPFDNVCWMLYCGNGTHAISTHPALEGTKCDDSRHCRSGKCVKA